MPDDSTNTIAKIYEGTSLAAKALVPDADVPFVEEVTFKFVQDGELFEETTVPVTQGGDGAGEGDEGAVTGGTVVSHWVEAPPVPDDKDSYFLEYHFFYKSKTEHGNTETYEYLAVQRVQVFPRTAQLKVTWAKDDEPFLDFPFKVSQNGEERSVVRTFLHDTVNALGETVPAGTAEFNLGLYPGFRIVQETPFEITEEVVGAGRKREVKGDRKFRSEFIAPEKGTVKQYVNYDVEAQGQTGLGHEVTIEVGVHPEDQPYVQGEEEVVVHFRVSYGPEAEEAVAKSERDDADHPTKVLKVTESDTSSTIEEKEANKQYEGKVTLEGGSGKFIVGLGKAGGDTCLVEIAGSDKFLTDESLSPDATLQFENWRRVHYELMVPDIMQDSALDPSSLNFREEVLRRLDTLGRQLFIEFVHDTTHVFDAVEQADDGTLAPRRFLALKQAPDDWGYVLSGRNWREQPKDASWKEAHPGKTLYIALCDRLLKWRQDAEDPQAGTVEFSGTLTEATGMVDMEERFGGLFMPFSGDDAGDSLADVTWTADISKDDPVCTYMPELEIEENRYLAPDETILTVVLEPDEVHTVSPGRINFEGTSNDDQEAFDSELTATAVGTIKDLVESLLADRATLCEVEAKVAVRMDGPEDTGHGEDDCFNAVKNKLQELFDETKAEFVYHPGLDDEGEPREAMSSLRDLTDLEKSTMREWHFELPAVQPDGTAGPGAFVGPEKTRDQCPVMLAFAFQPHEASSGETDGKLLAWATEEPDAKKTLLRLFLQGFNANPDEACLDHGHGTEGQPGDCLAEDHALCTACMAYGRSKDLTVL